MYRIAIVDDNDTWCFVVANRLQMAGYEVKTFTDANLFLGEADQFDLALIDFSIPPRPFLPELDGPDIIQQVRQTVPNPPWLVLISAYFTEEILRQAPDICEQADLCLSKQGDGHGLIRHIERLLKTRSPLNRDRPSQERSQYANQRTFIS